MLSIYLYVVGVVSDQYFGDISGLGKSLLREIIKNTCT